MEVKYSQNEFYQEKYTYYKKMVQHIVYTSCIASFFYWFTDCMLYGRISYETLLPRAFIFLPMLVFYVIQKYVHNYKVNVIAAYVVIHFVIFCTEWAVFHLENRTHANEGLMVIECIFIFMGMACPKNYSMVAHYAVIVDILIANLFIHYDDFITIIALHIILIVASELTVAYLENVFRERYEYQHVIEYATFHDQLTHAYNRNVMKSLCEEGKNNLITKDVGILILDIDYFKKINDTYGHDVGDVVLVQFAKILDKEIKFSDTLIRWGGEEFVIILKDVTKEQMGNIAKRINESVRRNLEGYHVTVSIGGTLYDDPEDYHVAVKRADSALYQVKQNGRNSYHII